MLRLIVFVIIAACIEAFMLVRRNNQMGSVKKDPMAIPYKATKVEEPSFNYIPGRTTYDDKSGRFVTDWKYEWEYKGKKHTMMVCDNPNSQYEHYMTVFPDEIDITIHKETGKYYVDKVTRSKSRSSLLILVIAMGLSWIITGLIFR